MKSPSRSRSLQEHYNTLERNKLLVTYFKGGMGYAELGTIFRISRQRVYEIIQRELKNGRTNQTNERETPN